jgi:hypothetical protein
VGRAERVNTGVVDQDVDVVAAELGSPLGQGPDAGRVSEIRDDENSERKPGNKCWLACVGAAETARDPPVRPGRRACVLLNLLDAPCPV